MMNATTLYLSANQFADKETPLVEWGELSASVSGFTAEKRQGRVRTLGAGETFHCEIEIGTLTAAKAEQTAAMMLQVVDAAERH